MDKLPPPEETMKIIIDCSRTVPTNCITLTPGTITCEEIINGKSFKLPSTMVRDSSSGKFVQLFDSTLNSGVEAGVKIVGGSNDKEGPEGVQNDQGEGEIGNPVKGTGKNMKKSVGGGIQDGNGRNKGGANSVISDVANMDKVPLPPDDFERLRNGTVPTRPIVICEELRNGKLFKLPFTWVEEVTPNGVKFVQVFDATGNSGVEAGAGAKMEQIVGWSTDKEGAEGVQNDQGEGEIRIPVKGTGKNTNKTVGGGIEDGNGRNRGGASLCNESRDGTILNVSSKRMGEEATSNPNKLVKLIEHVTVKEERVEGVQNDQGKGEIGKGTGKNTNEVVGGGLGDGKWRDKGGANSVGGVGVGEGGTGTTDCNNAGAVGPSTAASHSGTADEDKI